VLLGALLHASWNALVKSSADKALDTALIHLLGSVLTLPLLFLVGLPRPEAWPFIAASAAIHVAYYFLLVGAYRNGELGLTYPLMRGTAPLLVAMASALTLGEMLQPLAWVGVLAICAGVLALGLTPHALQSRRAVAFALCNAVVIALYTVVDAQGARSSGNALQYVVALFVVDGWPFGLYILMKRGQAVWVPYAQARWPMAVGGALASLGSYGIALWAMTQAPVATVAALRETSVLFAVLIGVWFLKERITAQRMLGAAAILGGVMALRLS
jgi:phosphonate utilization associated putative membrane protein